MMTLPSPVPQVKALQATLTQMSQMVSKMKQDRESSAKHVQQLQASFEKVLTKIRNQPLTKPQVRSLGSEGGGVVISLA